MSLFASFETNAPIFWAHPMDSPKLLGGLLKLIRSGELGPSAGELDQIIPILTLRRFLSALHYRDVETLEHSRRVGLISVGIGSRLGWEDFQLRLIEIAALLHDIGKIGIPDHILRKPGKLSPDEAEYIAAHHRVTIGLLQACHVHEDVCKIIAQSHGVDEALNSSREKISTLGSRILAVADAFDSLTANQPYRRAHDRESALKILEEQTGKGFDRNIVAALNRWLQSPESSALTDETAIEAAIAANAPHDDHQIIDAIGLCLTFQQLYNLETLYEAFYIVDRDQRLVTWNSGATRLFGISSEDVLGQPWHQSIVNAMPGEKDPVIEAFKDRGPHCQHLELKDVQGNRREFDIQSVPIVDQHGDVMAVAGLICTRNESKQHQGQFRQLQMAATRDPLTGVLNRGELEEQLTNVFTCWEAEPVLPFSIIFFDIDHFKTINDRFTHAVGDRVLIDIARLVQDELYSGEVIGRYGGEEFVVICPETPLEGAIDRAERLRRAIMGAVIADQVDLKVTASFGVTQVEPADTQETVIKRADEALYQAKETGRNRTCKKVTRRIKMSPKSSEIKQQKDFVHRAEIVTCVASSMLPLKLKGYVNDNEAKILDVKDNEVVLQIGSAGLFGGWGKTGERQPVKVRLQINEITSEESRSGTRRVQLRTTTQPVGKPATSELFHNRASHVIESIRSYLIAD